MLRKTRAVGLALAISTCTLIAKQARADADGAKKDIAQAQTDLGNNDFKSAGDNLQLAEAELDGLDDATKADLTKQINDLKQKLTDVQGSSARDDAKKQMDSLMDTARQSLDS